MIASAVGTEPDGTGFSLCAGWALLYRFTSPANSLCPNKSLVVVEIGRNGQQYSAIMLWGTGRGRIEPVAPYCCKRQETEGKHKHHVVTGNGRHGHTTPGYHIKQNIQATSTVLMYDRTQKTKKKLA